MVGGVKLIHEGNTRVHVLMINQGDMNSMERVLHTLEDTPWEQETVTNAREEDIKENQQDASSGDGKKKKKKKEEEARPPYNWHTPLHDNDKNQPLYTSSSLPSSSSSSSSSHVNDVNNVNNNKNWPVNGVVEFRNVTLRYRSNAPKALNQVSFLVNAGER